LEREYLFIMRHIKMQHFQQTYLIRTHFDSPFEFDPLTFGMNYFCEEINDSVALRLSYVSTFI
jgi:hypothetical protein